jgi:hypothetical protein
MGLSQEQYHNQKLFNFIGKKHILTGFLIKKHGFSIILLLANISQLFFMLTVAFSL